MGHEGTTLRKRTPTGAATGPPVSPVPDEHRDGPIPPVTDEPRVGMALASYCAVPVRPAVPDGGPAWAAVPRAATSRIIVRSPATALRGSGFTGRAR